MSEAERKSVLILGCGYLGIRLVREALAKGMRVKAVSRNLDTLREAKSIGADVFQGMVNEDGWHMFAGRSVDFVVNCVSSAGGGLEGYRTSYVDGNASLARWVRKFGFSGTAVYTSSVSAFGDSEGKWVDEATGASPSNERGKLVLESEKVFLEGVGAGRGIVLRLAGLYGPERHLMLDTIRSGEGELPGWGDYYLNLVRIEDVCGAVWASLENASVASGVYAVVDDEPSLKEDIVGWLAARLGLGEVRFSGKVLPGGIGARRLQEGGRPANRRIRNAKLKESSGWRPRFATFRKGFEDLLRES